MYTYFCQLKLKKGEKISPRKQIFWPRNMTRLATSTNKVIKKLTADEQNSILGIKFFAVLYLDSETTGVRINNGDEAIADVSDDEDDKGEGQNMVE